MSVVFRAMNLSKRFGKATVLNGLDLEVRAVSQGGEVSGNGITPQAVYLIVRGYARQLGFPFAPHDLRRTFAQLAHRGRSPLEQIQMSLGHESILTTEKYLGVRQNLTDAPCDHLGIELEQH